MRAMESVLRGFAGGAFNGRPQSKIAERPITAWLPSQISRSRQLRPLAGGEKHGGHRLRSGHHHEGHRG